MPLFDLFKKSNNKEPGKEQKDKAAKPATNNPLVSLEMQKKHYEAATEFLKVFQEKMPLLNGRPHAGTVISIAARLAGTSLFRSIHKKDFDPGMVVLSEEVNNAYPELLDLFAYYCMQNGVNVMAKPLVQVIPDQNKPLMDLAQVQAEYLKPYNLIMRKHGLDNLESARAGMVLCSIVFHYHCIENKGIDPYVAIGIVAMGVIEGAKTSQMPLKSKGSMSTPASSQNAQNNQMAGLLRSIAGNSTGGSGTRLVLGEGMLAMRETLNNGGKYILVNPGVLMKLEESNIDPFLVYETALRMELESKIPRIDFVNANVDELVQEWSGKPEEQAPLHVRQMLWLKANAEKYGYQQSGNSWTLK
jgi:hypothetical protein